MGAGIGMGNTCKPMAVLFQCMTKFTTNKYINKLKKKKESACNAGDQGSTFETERLPGERNGYPF